LSAAVAAPPPTLVRRAEIEGFERETDVLVVGLGCAGACASLEAADAGAEVLALERASAGGGTSALSGGVIYLGGGTAVQREAGFEDSAEDMYRYLMASAGPRPDEKKVAAFSEGSLEHFAWLVAQGLEFKPVFYPHYSGEPPNEDGLVYSGSENAWPYNEIARPAPRGHCPRTPGAAGGLLMQTLLRAVSASPVEVVNDARCESLVRDDDGGIVGVVARIDGRRVPLRARRGVILTTGGFINDDEMLSRHAPLLRRCRFRVGAEGDDGSGIRLGLTAGAGSLHLGHGSISLPVHPPKSVSRGIFINRAGQRFVNEDVYMGTLGEHVLLRQDGEAYLLFDDENFVRPEIEYPLIAVGETPLELEDQLGMAPGALQATLDLYNRYAREGRDPVFHKHPDYVKPLTKPPYGVFDCRVDHAFFAAFTLGGLWTNASGEVLSPSGDVMPGLYAAGRTTSGIAAPGYSSGLSLGDGSFFGRAAGRAAALRRGA